MVADSSGAHRLDGRVVVVTGGNGGIGLGLVRGLIDAGASVGIWARSSAKTESAIAGLGDAGESVAGFRCDVTDEDEVTDALAATVERFGRLDAFFANAGTLGPSARLVDLDLDGWRGTLRINLEGQFLCLRAAARHLIRQDEGGALVTVSSVSSIHGSPGKPAYAAAKAGVAALARTAAVELARHRIRVNTLVPGWVDTTIFDDLDATAMGRVREVTTARTPVRRWGRPDDIAAVAPFLADPTLTFHTGDTLVVDGGYSIS